MLIGWILKMWPTQETVYTLAENAYGLVELSHISHGFHLSKKNVEIIHIFWNQKGARDSLFDEPIPIR